MSNPSVKSNVKQGNSLYNIVDSEVKRIKRYDTKIGATDIAYKMVVDELKSTNESQENVYQAILYFADSLRELNLLKQTRATFKAKDLLRNKFRMFLESEAKLGSVILDKAHSKMFPNNAGRYLIQNEEDKCFHVVTLNIGKLKIK